MFKKFLLSFICISIVCISFAQGNSETNIFDNTITKLFIPLHELHLMESKAVDDEIIISFGNDIKLPLKINMNVWNDKTIHTIGAKLLNATDAYCTITFYKINGIEKIEGSLFSKKEPTGFKIYITENNMVCFEKVNQNQLISE